MTSCASFEDPIEFISYDGSNLEKFNLDEAAFRVQSTVHNHTWLPIKIKPSTLEVYVDGKKWIKMDLPNEGLFSTFNSKNKENSRKIKQDVVYLGQQNLPHENQIIDYSVNYTFEEKESIDFSLQLQITGN